MNGGRRSQLANAWLTVILLAVILACVNYLASDRYLRVDLTSDDRFTLSDAAVGIVRSLDAPVRVEVFLSEDLPPQFALHTQRIRDKLAEFKGAARQAFEVVYTDPTGDPEAESRARRLGVVPRETSARSRNKLESQVTWLGLTLHYRDGERALPFIDSTAPLEYEVARALRELQSGTDEPTIGVVTGRGEPDLAAALDAQGGPIHAIAAALDDGYELRAVELARTTEISADIDVLLVLGPQQPYSDAALFALDQHVMRGGALGVFPLAALPDPRARTIRPAPVDLSRLLGAWGIQLGSDLIVQRDLNGIIQLPGRIRTARGDMPITQQVNSPLVPILRDLDREHPVTRRLESLVAPFAAPITQEPRPGVEVFELARSTEGSTVGARVNSLDPRALAELQDSEVAGPSTVLVALRGALPSAWAGQEAPLPDDEASAVASGDAGLQRAPDGTRVVIGNSFELPIANPGLLLSAVDWMAADETLLGIRPRMTPPAVLEIPAGRRTDLLRYGNAVGWPLLVLGLGLLRVRLRR